MDFNMVGWFEIPVTDLARASAFYEKVLGIDIQIHQMGDLEMGWFPRADGKPGASGSLAKHPDFYFPSDSRGTLVYFSCADVAPCLSRVEEAGGTILQTKKQIAEGFGYMGLFLDSEGNRVALHSSR